MSAEWKSWFAWHPVKAYDPEVGYVRWTWLRRVDRLTIGRSGRLHALPEPGEIPPELKRENDEMSVKTREALLKIGGLPRPLRRPARAVFEGLNGYFRFVKRERDAR